MQTIKKVSDVFTWYIFGGIIMGFLWLVAGMIMFVSIAGIPIGKVCLDMSRFNFFPFGKLAISKNEFYGQEEFATDCRNIMCKQFWFVLAGWWLVSLHFLFAIVNFISIIGITSAHRHLDIVCIAFNPIDQIIVTETEAAKAKKNNAQKRIQKLKKELSI